MCKKTVKKPMRLQQCPQVCILFFKFKLLCVISVTTQGHVICDNCYDHLKTTASSDNRERCVTCRTKYCGRPSELEKVLGLLDDVVICSDSD